MNSDMDPTPERIERIRKILIYIILGTLPLYLVGLIMLFTLRGGGHTGGSTITPTMTNTRFMTITSTPPTLVYFPTATTTLTPSITPTPTITPTFTITPTRTMTSTATETPTATYTATATNTLQPTATFTPTYTDTSIPPTP